MRKQRHFSGRIIYAAFVPHHGAAKWFADKYKLRDLKNYARLASALKRKKYDFLSRYGGINTINIRSIG